jgi:hypothetical protein
MAKKPKPQPPVGTGTEYLSTAEAAKLLGTKPRNMRNYVVRRLLPRRMIGASLVFLAEELEPLKGKVPLRRGRKAE